MGERDKENVNSQIDQSTPVTEVRRSSKNIRPPQHYSSALNYLLLTTQKEGIDYTEIFSPVVKMSIIRLVLGMVVAENLHLEQLDVKTAFLHGDLEEDIYMIQSKEFIVQEQENLVYKLRKTLYGLKQAPRQWYKKFDSFMHRNRFKRCKADHC